MTQEERVSQVFNRIRDYLENPNKVHNAVD